MIDIVYNDTISDLTLIANQTNVTLVIIDGDLNKYFEIDFEPFVPTYEEIVAGWENAVKKYYDLDSEENKLIEWRKTSAKKSIELFKEFAKTEYVSEKELGEN